MQEAGAEGLEELMARKALARVAVLELRNNGFDDPRAPDAIAYYEAQEAEINAKIAELMGGAPPVVVGLKAVSLCAKAES